MAGQSLTFGSPVEAGFAGEFFCAKGDQVAPVANKRSARGLRLHQLPVSGKDGRGLLHICEQSARAFGQCHVVARALS